MKKGAIFDQDGLMFDTEMIYEKCWYAVAEELGFEVPDAFFTEICGSSGENMLNVIRRFIPQTDPKEYVRLVFARSHEMQDINLPEKKGLREILEFFRENGVRMAVASSTVRSRVEKNLRKSGIDGYFQTLVTGDEVSNGKPDPEIFLKAAEKLGLAPEECYVLEDSYNGIRAGHAAGCFSIMVPDRIAPDEEILGKCDLCCENLLEVMEKIRNQ